MRAATSVGRFEQAGVPRWLFGVCADSFSGYKAENTSGDAFSTSAGASVCQPLARRSARREEVFMATTMCEIDGRRPAVASVRIRQNGEERTIAVCEEHLRELQGQSRGAGRSPFGGRSLFDEFFSDFFGDSGLGSRTPGAAGGTTTTRPRRPGSPGEARSRDRPGRSDRADDRSGALQPDDRVLVDYDDVQLTFDIDKGAAEAIEEVEEPESQPAHV